MWCSVGFYWTHLNCFRKCPGCYGRRIWCIFSSDESEHYSDVIMTAMASQITGVSIVYSTVCSGGDQRKHQISATLAYVREIHWWIARTKDQWRGKCFHLMTSSWYSISCSLIASCFYLYLENPRLVNVLGAFAESIWYASVHIWSLSWLR